MNTIVNTKIGIMIKEICVFGGANTGLDPEIVKITQKIGKKIAQENINIICGGGDSGLMSVITDAALGAGGKVTGVFSDVLKDTPHAKLSNLIHTPSLFARKQYMIDNADAFLILPGGYGTLDEFFEVVVLQRLGKHNKPIVLLNYNGFWDYTLKQIDRMKREGFVSNTISDFVKIITNFEEFFLE